METPTHGVHGADVEVKTRDVEVGAQEAGTYALDVEVGNEHVDTHASDVRVSVSQNRPPFR